MKLRYVDGYKIRQNLDPDFSIIHYRDPNRPFLFDSKWYIPPEEIWFDQSFKNEENFLEKILLSAVTRAQARKFTKEGKPPRFVIREEKKNGLAIQFVDGKIVREFFDPEFVFGGHDLVYSYVPKKTVWLDNRMDPKDIPHILLHELTERKLMAEEKKSYAIAHDYATAAEKESRRRAGGVYLGDTPERFRKFPVKDFYVK